MYRRRHKRAAEVLSATFGWPIDTLTQYRYQPTLTAQATYLIKGVFYCISSHKPTVDVGAHWEKYEDQYYAEELGTCIWVAS